MSPSDEEGLLNLCDTLFRLEKWTEAEEVIRYVLRAVRLCSYQSV